MHRSTLASLALTALVAATAFGALPAREARTGSEDRTSLALTVYSAGRGMVTDTRSMELPAGRFALAFRDVAGSIIPETVAADAGVGAVVLEQNYEYDLLSPRSLLEKYVGETLVMELAEPVPGGGERVRTVEATLLSTNDGTVWRLPDGIVVNPDYEQLFFPAVPGTLRERPTLVWLVDNERAGAHEVEASYLAERIGWHADYVLTLDEDGAVGDLDGWITLDNRSGTGYENALLRLVAGDVNLAPKAVPMPRRGMNEEIAMATADMAREETFSEYHLYTIDRPVTVLDNQTKQVALLAADGVAVGRTYRVQVGHEVFGRTTGLRKPPVQVELDLANEESNRLGMPLPAGTVRVYRTHRDGSAIFVGEDRIGHTPEDETVDLKLGTAFDVVAESRQTDYERLGSQSSETAWETELRNHKREAVEVEVVVPLAGDWTILDSSHPFEELDAHRAAFTVTVPADGAVDVTWRVRTRW